MQCIFCNTLICLRWLRRYLSPSLIKTDSVLFLHSRRRNTYIYESCHSTIGMCSVACIIFKITFENCSPTNEIKNWINHQRESNENGGTNGTRKSIFWVDAHGDVWQQRSLRTCDADRFLFLIFRLSWYKSQLVAPDHVLFQWFISMYICSIYQSFSSVPRQQRHEKQTWVLSTEHCLLSYNTSNL